MTKAFEEVSKDKEISLRSVATAQSTRYGQGYGYGVIMERLNINRTKISSLVILIKQKD